MKRIDDIEKTGFQELERIAADESVEVPAELEGRVRDTLTSAVLAGGGTQCKRSVRPAARAFMPAVLAGAAAALAVVLAINMQEPKDTFDDPAQAYAQLEETFRYISDKMSQGFGTADEALQAMNRPAGMIEKTLKNIE